jgi:UDP-2,3-diacylglucosamine pyrophosphatase LpxH
MHDAIVISDIHLGSRVCQARQLADLLKSIEFGQIQTKRLIINGDLFDDWDFRKLKKSHWKVLSHIRKVAGIAEVVWIRGNHDGPAEVISHLIGVEFLEEYELRSGDKRILILHGDRFDSFIAKRPILTKFADNFYRLVQRLDRSFYLAKLLKRGSKTFLRCSEQIRDRARQHAARRGFDAVVCSHVHMEMEDREGPVEYYNTGCWTETPSCYLVVSEGQIRLVRVP